MEYLNDIPLIETSVTIRVTRVFMRKTQENGFVRLRSSCFNFQNSPICIIASSCRGGETLQNSETNDQLASVTTATYAASANSPGSSAGASSSAI